jgi:hypothetical protein
MNIRQYSNAKEFLSHAGKYLARDEARYGLILGLAKAVQRNPNLYGKDNPWFCSVGDGDDINAVAMRTPPYMVLLAYFSGDLRMIAETLIKAVSGKFKVIPGVMGDKGLADILARLWCEKYGIKIVDTMAQRIFRLDKVNDISLSPGKFRVATMADKELVKKWGHAFHVDIGGVERNMPQSDITPVLERGWVFLWEDGKPVSMALKTRPTENGMTVGGVYTPPELRRRGYATSCVAELSRNILQTDKKFCMLYTDLANPTSNSIYKKIGYKEVCDSAQHSFKIPSIKH